MTMHYTFDHQLDSDGLSDVIGPSATDTGWVMQALYCTGSKQDRQNALHFDWMSEVSVSVGQCLQ